MAHQTLAFLIDFYFTGAPAFLASFFFVLSFGFNFSLSGNDGFACVYFLMKSFTIPTDTYAHTWNSFTIFFWKIFEIFWVKTTVEKLALGNNDVVHSVYCRQFLHMKTNTLIFLHSFSTHICV